MSNENRIWSDRPIWKIGALTILGLLLLARLSFAQMQLTETEEAVLQGTVKLIPTRPLPNGEVSQIQPGTAVKLVVTVENTGQQASPSGELYVQYSYIHPLDKENGSILFESEKKPLPPIEPGKKVEISFDAVHQIPSLLDFIRYDWSYREYKAIAVIKKEEFMIGSLALTFFRLFLSGRKQRNPCKS